MNVLRLRNLVCTILALVLASGLAHATNFPVTKTADTADGVCDADCSLREAIIAANANAGPDVITLGGGTYNFTIAGANENASATGDLDITGELDINGAGIAATIIDAQDLDRVFHILGGPVDIRNLTIRNGTADAGGGIFIAVNTPVLIEGVIVTGHVSTGAGGGGIRSGGVLTLSDSTVSNNITNDQQGAGIMALNTTTIQGSTISGNNTMGDQGGGIFLLNANMTITNSTISGNTASSGGGIYNNPPVSTANNVTITSTTIANNTGGNTGGGIATFAPGIVTLTGTILSGNSATVGPDCAEAIVSGGFNLIQNTSGCTITGTTTGNVTGQSAQLAPLANNCFDKACNPAETHALLSSSPALNAWTTGCPPPSIDQRGVTRPQSTACEIGAFECLPTECGGGVGPTATPTPTQPGPTATPTPTQPGPTATPTPTSTPTVVPPTATATNTPVTGAPAANVPTLSFPMLALLGLALATTAILFVRRG